MKTKYDVFFFEAFKEERHYFKKFLPANIKAGYTPDTIQEYKNKDLPASIISIRTQSVIPESWTNNMAAILSRTTGFDHLEKYKREIPCAYLPSYCIRAVAEQAALFWLSLLRKLPQQLKHFSDFNRDNLTGHDCQGKKIVVVGVGKIGYEIYKIAQGLEMMAFGVDIIKRHKDVNYIAIKKGLKLADIIVCSMNLTPKNQAYFNYSLFKEAKRGVVFINVARGELSPAADLLKLVSEGHLGGLALDVFNKEALVGESLRTKVIKNDKEVKSVLKLMKKENVILTPHNAFNTLESVEKKASQTVEHLLYFMKNGRFIIEVN